MGRNLLWLWAVPAIVFGQESGRIEPVAGAPPNYGEQRAEQMVLQSPTRVLSAGPGGIYFSEPNRNVFRVDPEGNLRTFASIATIGPWSDTDETGAYWYCTGTSIRKITPEGVDGSAFDFIGRVPDVSLLLRSPSAIACRNSASCFLSNGNGVFSFPGPISVAAYSATARNARRLSAKASGLLAIDASGRRVLGSPNGSAVAGSGQFGAPIEGQPATEAAFGSLVDVTEDSERRVLIADSVNRAVYRIEDGKIQTMAGAADGPRAEAGFSAREARFLSVESIAVDGAGRLLIVDPATFTVWAVGADGLLARAAGRAHKIGASPSESELSDPNGLAADTAGNFYIVDRLGFRILYLGADGKWEIVAGTGNAASNGDGGPAVDAAIQPTGPLAVDPDGFVYFVDVNNSVRRFQRGGAIEAWLTRDNFEGVDPATVFIRGIAADARGELAVSTFTEIYRVMVDRKLQRVELGNIQPGATRQLERFAKLDDGSLVFVDRGQLMRVDSAGAFTLIPAPFEANRCLSGNSILASAGTGVLVASATAICRFSSDGTFAILAGASIGPPIPDGAPALSGALSTVTALVSGGEGAVIFTERATNRVRRFVP